MSFLSKVEAKYEIEASVKQELKKMGAEIEWSTRGDISGI
jgi:hypothetical protein